MEDIELSGVLLKDLSEGELFDGPAAICRRVEGNIGGT